MEEQEEQKEENTPVVVTQKATKEKRQPRLTTPVAILISGILVAAVIGYTNIQSNKQVTTAQVAVPGAPARQQNSQDLLNNVLPVDDSDHIRGAKNPKLTIIEYSDFECPFCKRFHVTMNTIIKKYPDDVAWVYRHFPIESLHPVKAVREALASECAAVQQGSEGFWTFTDRLMELVSSNNRTNLEVVLPQIVAEMKLDSDKFFKCVDNAETQPKVARDLQNAIDTGGNGTPWSIVVLNDGTKIPLSGAQSVEAISTLVDAVVDLSNKGKLQ